MDTTTKTLFNRPEILVSDPNTLDADDDRLAKQNLILYVALRVLGTLSNDQIIRITKTRKHTSRISDVRRWLQENIGETIKCTYGEGGLNYYTIVKGD